MANWSSEFPRVKELLDQFRIDMHKTCIPLIEAEQDSDEFELCKDLIELHRQYFILKDKADLIRTRHFGVF